MFSIEEIKKMNEERCSKVNIEKSNMVQRIARELSLDVAQAEKLKAVME